MKMVMPGSAVTSTRAARIVWHVSADESAWIVAATGGIYDALQAELGAHSTTWLLLSGGTTPAPVYSALATQVLEWTRIVVSLVDDRDVDPEADGSNERLVRETLLRERAARARFRPLHTEGQSLEDAVRASNASWLRSDDSPGVRADGVGDHPANFSDGSASVSIAAAVLGMGDDGHTASLFPGAANLDAAFASVAPYAAIDATGCPVAGIWPRRISLTPAGLAPVRHCVLLIRGAEKRATFERALAPGDARDMPIRVAIDRVDSPLHVYWCP
jgi:6-phosphogluconolactonase